MLVFAALLGTMGAAVLPPVHLTPTDTSATALSIVVPVAPAAPGIPLVPSVSAIGATGDTTRARPRAIEVSDWYNRRLTIHRWTAYAIPPLFAYQWYMGEKLWHGLDQRGGPASWVRPAHRAGAYTIATAFTINTVTGVWNLWDSRHVEEGRTLRYAHALTMLVADAGFTYAGAKLSQEAKTSLVKRREHRTVALTSMGLTVASGAMMLVFNR